MYVIDSPAMRGKIAVNKALERTGRQRRRRICHHKAACAAARRICKYLPLSISTRAKLFLQRIQDAIGIDIKQNAVDRFKGQRTVMQVDQLRQGVGLQAYGQRDPLVEYKLSGYEMFDEMTQNIREETVRLLFHVRVEQKVEREQVAKVTGTNKDDSLAKAPAKREKAKIYPNDPCPCGSGKKYKQCCGRK